MMEILGLYGQKTVAIIPEPACVSLESNTNESFLLHEKLELVFTDTDAICNSANFLNDYLEKYYHCRLEEVRQGRGEHCIKLEIKPDEKAKTGGYQLKVFGKNCLEITGYNPEGLFYGVQTFLQLLNPSDKKCCIPFLSIEDEPRFEYRGMHLDVVRHLFPVEYIKKYIDYLAMHKMNYFHWHLTDDQGWRMESKSHPEVNRKGAYRRGTIIGLFPGTGVDDTPYGGFYTIEQLKEIVDYAAKRYITIVPEIDIPGHSMAILAAYPRFGTEPERLVEPAITWGIFNRENNVLAPHKEVFQFLEDVFNELMDVFPGKYIHIGADECAHMWWRESPEVQRFIKENHLEDEHGLQRFFAQKVSDVITARGRVVIGWDEMVDSGLVDDVVVMSWRDAEGAYKAAELGHKAILTPMSYSYFNIQQKENEEALCHTMETVSLDKVYKFEPVPDTLSAVQAANIIGGEGCMWTEYFPSVSSVEYGVFPRMSAIAEVYWSAKRVKNWPAFLLKLPVQFCRYDMWGANYCTHVFEQECFPKK